MTHAFKDAEGREWQLKLNVGSLTRARDLADVKLGDGVELARIADDPALFGRVLYALLKPQIDEKGISPEDFAEAFDGDVVQAATEALMEEICLFTPPAKRAMLRKILDKGKELEGKRTAWAEDLIEDGYLEKLHQEELDAFKRQLDERIERLRNESTLSDSAGNSLASPESIPSDPSPS